MAMRRNPKHQPTGQIDEPWLAIRSPGSTVDLFFCRDCKDSEAFTKAALGLRFVTPETLDDFKQQAFG